MFKLTDQARTFILAFIVCFNVGVVVLAIIAGLFYWLGVAALFLLMALFLIGMISAIAAMAKAEGCW